MRSPAPTPRSTPHTPLRFDWTEEKLRPLSQEQLLNLLDNLDRQRIIGRIPEADATELDTRIVSLLTTQNCTRRRKQVAKRAIADSAFQADSPAAP